MKLYEHDELDVLAGTVTDATCELVVYTVGGDEGTRVELRRRWEPVSDEWSLSLDSGPGWALERDDVTLAAEQAWAAHDEAQRMSWHR